MKKGWEIKKLGEVATFSQGIQVGLEQHLTEPKNGYVRFIRIIDYTQNTDDIRYVPNPGEKYFVNENDIVMVRYGTPGLIGRGKSGVIANNLFRIKIERKELSNDYLSLFLSQDSIQNYLSTQGSATMPALNFGQLKTVEVKFPPLPEQQRIVSILDEAFSVIERSRNNAEQNLKNAKELFESYLQGVFE
ncbi:MAG: restriction endonuclease subunit S, partial [Paludibacter sp.]|nr:restriction endonuclease subunit S [Paludibacter sp.]